MLLQILPISTNFQARKKQTPNLDSKELALRFANENLTVEEIEKARQKFPKLDYYHPYTIEYNIREFVNLHKNDGLTVKEHLKVAKVVPTLFASNPQTLSENISILYNFVEKYGITKKDIIEKQNRNPILRAMSPYTIIKKLTEIPEYYKDYGLDEETYVKKCFTNNLLGINLNKFKSNEEAITEHFAHRGMTKNDYIELFKKQPSVACASANVLIDKLDLWNYIEENKLVDSKAKYEPRKFLDSVLRKNLSHSKETDLLYLLRCKLNTYHNLNLHSKKMKEQIPKLLLDNPEKIYKIPILRGSFVKEFEKIISELSYKTIGKNAFKIIIK